jgi:peptidoglycan-associated lipoprotein
VRKGAVIRLLDKVRAGRETTMNNAKRYAVVLILAALAGCHTTPKTPGATGAMNQNAATSEALGTPAVTGDELNNPASPLAKRSIYFDFDSYDVKSDYQSLLQAHADYLRRHPAQHVLIQGNTDERGTTEYNLAPGERRSQAVLHVLETLGVPDPQLEAVSFGKEKPVAPGHDEASWAQNRRADLVYR